MPKENRNTERITFVTDEATKEKLTLYAFYRGVSVGHGIRTALHRWLTSNKYTADRLVVGIAARMHAAWELKLLKHQADPSKGMESKAAFIKSWRADMEGKLSQERIDEIIALYEKDYK